MLSLLKCKVVPAQQMNIRKLNFSPEKISEHYIKSIIWPPLIAYRHLNASDYVNKLNVN